MYGKGISKEGEVLDSAVKLEIVQKSGGWFSYGGERLGQGRDNVKKLIKSKPELRQELEEKIKEALSTTASAKEKSSEVTAAVKAGKKGKSTKKADINVNAEDFDTED